VTTLRDSAAVYEVDKRAFTIGRAATCDVVLAAEAVLPVHVRAKLRRRGDAFVLVLEPSGPVELDGASYDGRDVVAGATLVIGGRALRVVDITEPTAWWKPGAWFGGNVRRVPPPPPSPPPTPPPTVNPPPPMRTNNPPPAPQLPPRVPYVAPSDPTEATLLEALRRDPADAANRMVYADWLEQLGDAAAAHVVRGGGEHLDVRTFAWRAIVTRTAYACDVASCPGAWDRLAPVDATVAERTCGTCDKRVVYCRKQSGDGYYANFSGLRSVIDR